MGESHWMSLNGKREDFSREDFYSLEKLSPLFSRKKINQLIDQTISQVSKWRKLATQHAVPNTLIDEVESNIRLAL
jgi:serine/threonine-protein kinase HipA